MGAQHVATEGLELGPYPIPFPIHEGNPESLGQALVLSDDKKICGGLWQCSAGVFDWDYDYDEIVYILDGQATVEDRRTGQKCVLKKGDMAMFQEGMLTKWHIDSFVKKTFFGRRATPFE